MGKLDTRIIDGLDDAVAELFAPSITAGQTITCYVNEEMTPYSIQCDNVLALIGDLSTLSTNAKTTLVDAINEIYAKLL